MLFRSAQRIQDLFPEAKTLQRTEVINYLHLKKHTEIRDNEEYSVNLANGRLDLLTETLSPHYHEQVDFQRINATFDKTVHDEALEAMLLKVFCNDYDLHKLFEEMVGYCLTRNCKYQKMFIFTGEGSNGKSTIIKMLSHFFGETNVSAIDRKSVV